MFRLAHCSSPVKPGMPLPRVATLCRQVVDHNQKVKLLSEFWDLMLRTKLGGFNRSPFLDLQKAIQLDKGRRKSNKPASDGVYLAWSDDIHKSWHFNTVIMDATMSTKIVEQFYPQLMTNSFYTVDPLPHVRIRQITDRRISKFDFGHLVPGSFSVAKGVSNALAQTAREFSAV